MMQGRAVANAAAILLVFVCLGAQPCSCDAGALAMAAARDRAASGTHNAGMLETRHTTETRVHISGGGTIEMCTCSLSRAERPLGKRGQQRRLCSVPVCSSAQSSPEEATLPFRTRRWKLEGWLPRWLNPWCLAAGRLLQQTAEVTMQTMLVSSTNIIIDAELLAKWSPQFSLAFQIGQGLYTKRYMSRPAAAHNPNLDSRVCRIECIVMLHRDVADRQYWYLHILRSSTSD